LADLELFADLPDHGEAQRATVSLEPVQGDAVAKGAVADQVCTTNHACLA
jgi:hypothetical protein